jgi:alpha-aminoadipic semialdehyde synthase
VTEDVSPAATLLGVKEVESTNLIPNRSYVFFGHVIKAQPYNMPLLDSLLQKVPPPPPPALQAYPPLTLSAAPPHSRSPPPTPRPKTTAPATPSKSLKNIRFFDYEGIREGGLRDSRRLVAFGRYAGIAGFIDVLRGMGERLQCQGYSTPFLVRGGGGASLAVVRHLLLPFF